MICPFPLWLLAFMALGVTFKKIETGEARRLVKPDQVFNRIRVEDIGAAGAFLAHQMSNGIFNITDDLPAPPQDVVTYACSFMGIHQKQDFDTADNTYGA